MSAIVDAARTEQPPIDANQVRQWLDYYTEQEWTDGLPVVPVTESYLADFLANTPRHPDDVLLDMKHLNRKLTVRLAAINAALAGCKPEYFPVVVAAWHAIAQEPMPKAGIWQSTTGTAPFLVVNGPIRRELGINGAGNIFGSGFRANATIGRAIRLACINVFGLHPHKLDQATQANPSKYMMCFAENEEQSPWEPLHTDRGMDASDSAVHAFVIRAVMHIEARHTALPDQLARDFINSMLRTGALLTEHTNSLLVLSPEHAQLFHDAGWSKRHLQEFIFENAIIDRETLKSVGKEMISKHTKWRVPADHIEAQPDNASKSPNPDRLAIFSSPDCVPIIVAGANNAGVSSVVDIFGPPRLYGYSSAKVEKTNG